MKHFFTLFLFCFVITGYAQENLTYQKPHKNILELAEAPLAPSIRMDSKGEHIVLLYRSSYKTIEELSETELRLGGLRINPVTNIGSRTRYYTDVKLSTRNDGTPKAVSGLTADGRYANFSWSPNQEYMTFTKTLSTGVELWLLDIENASAKKISEANLNANMGNPVTWFKDSESLLVKVLPKNRAALINTSEAVPTGPTISVSEAGVKAQNRTYQDLLKNKNDEHNFEQLSQSELYKVTLDGKATLWKPAGMYRGISFSPDGNYIMLTTINKPFSYLVPYSRFPSESIVYTAKGDLVKSVLQVPLIEDLPQGFMAERTGKRDLDWRGDKPATLYWAEALDGGDPAKDVPFRDEVFQQDAPFNGKITSLLKTKDRFRGITWGDDHTAIAYDMWWNSRNTRTYVFDPSNASKAPKILFDRNYQDRYSDPGQFVSTKNEFSEYVLDLNKNSAYLIGDGYSDAGKFPFVDEINLSTTKTKRLYQSKLTDKVESISTALNAKSGEYIVSIESKNEYPNYYVRNIKKRNGLTPLTHFENPFKSLQDVKKEVISYKRADGLDLSGTLYLPTDYEAGKKYPMVMWAYPREYKDKNSAAQSTSSSNEFTYPYYGSPIYWVTRGYVVLDDAAFPIIGEGDEQPNDTFREQLVANAKAAIDAVDGLGYIDRDRVAVGGHSYGAFMTANLLAHSNLFAAGIARSGAYNRTLTPFGFQSEERNYWEAPEIYNSMSPFMHADKMKTPLLLIHGEADNNSGTYPLQSERYFNALKGLGAPVRLVMLPRESHGYSAKESILHMLWEQDQWLEEHVKNKEKTESAE
ncbi:alpha/beta hydrolase family protein [Formosa algae]|jgi:dipeptidyl aminopeptidase/acylaminoacyl peptidase|uniref:Dipeptidyl aminopeptidase/acylaminoacyl peptidase n=1 Tax=Formosa algae TaxID=225843 RepID=A0A9X0YMG5_9FLAO|nr:prolyl oligopeptidase family serine peptidase [Formosa algae]MBP1841462.1 dipeptidyl aminopeptidase/acylaminoacyl peptidase [Formosa algae]MDQ0336616.1 dipeptidyl aminopeptidase/acylaminoacyl peptidase [Formosa algae]OEI81924.1 aminoacyl peptidase [Formosa algae]